MTEENVLLASFKKTGMFKAKEFNSAIWLVASQSDVFMLHEHKDDLKHISMKFYFHQITSDLPRGSQAPFHHVSTLTAAC